MWSFSSGFIGKIPALRKWPWGNAKFWVILFLPQNQSKGFKHAHAALEHHLNQTKIDIFFSAIFWDKLRGHFRMLKSQNISHALCAHFSWLRTARWDEKCGWWRCPKLDANTLPNSQQPKRKKTQNVSKKIKLSQLQILVVNWPVAQMASIATKRNQTNSMAFSPVQGFDHSELLNMYSNALT